jgi:hypothetical protein
MLHLEYYVANLICKFEWRAVDGDDVDLSERTERTNGDEESIACPHIAEVVEFAVWKLEMPFPLIIFEVDEWDM